MNFKSKVFSTAIGLMMSVAAAPAFAAPIIGGISFSDGFESTGTTTSIVSQLVAINLINGPGVAQATGCTGSFGTCTPPPAVFANAVNDFTIGVGPVLTYSYNGFNFTINSFNAPTRNPLNCAGQICTDSLVFTGNGTVDDGPGGLDASDFSISWTANGSCVRNQGSTATQCDNSVTASWSASISATGAPVRTPEPASMVLAGLGLLGVGYTLRKRGSLSA